MMEGTKRLFPTEYEDFRNAMVEAANKHELPAALMLDDIKDFTLRDFQDLFIQFNLETGLEMTGSMAISEKTGRLQLCVEIRQAERPKQLIQ